MQLYNLQYSDTQYMASKSGGNLEMIKDLHLRNGELT